MTSLEIATRAREIKQEIERAHRLLNTLAIEADELAEDVRADFTTIEDATQLTLPIVEQFSMSLSRRNRR